MRSKKTRSPCGFGSSTPDRFAYVDKLRKTKKNFNGLDNLTDHLISKRQRGASFSIGVSRSAMNKIYIDEIIKNGDKNSPGPVYFN